MRILVLEPYYGGSHRAFVEGLIAGSRHEFEVMTLPARKWKWRMRGSAIWFAREAWKRGDWRFDLVLANDMVSVTDWRALCPARIRAVPVVCYFHENQITYPLADESDRDFQYGFTHITTCLASDAIWFNSAYHRDEFREGADSLLRKMPDYVPDGLVNEIMGKSQVMHPGIQQHDSGAGDAAKRAEDRVTSIVWNHRWEYDKNPELFFAALIELDRLDCGAAAFDLYVVGEHFRTQPAIFEQAKLALGNHVRHWGFVPTRNEYLRILGGCDIVVSTAIHEFFGLSVLEAVSAGCQAILPARLSYPEIFANAGPSVARFFQEDAQLVDVLKASCTGSRSERDRQKATAFADRYSWGQRIGEFDDAFEAVVGKCGS